MKNYRIGLLYGDGIGPEIMKATVEILKAIVQSYSDLSVEWVEVPMGWEAIRLHNHPMPAETIEALSSCHGWIMGPHDSASYPDEMKVKLNPSGALRKHFDLYANIRPARNYPSVRSLKSGVDLVVVRENTEGFYADRNMYHGIGEFMPTPDIALATGVFTKQAATRIAHVAFQLATKRRKYVSIVHKANVLKLSNGLFLDTCYDVSKQYPNVRVDDYHIDAMTAHLLRRAPDFDVIVTTNMFGDILSDLTAELVGSLGMGGSLNASDKIAMAQATHGAAPDIANQGIANPTGIISSAIMLLQWMSTRFNDTTLQKIAQTLEKVLDQVLVEAPLTPDMGGNGSTDAFAEAMIEHLYVIT